MIPTAYTPISVLSAYSCLSGLLHSANAAAIVGNPPIVFPLTQGMHSSLKKRGAAEAEVTDYSGVVGISVTIRDKPYDLVLDSGDYNVWIAQSNFVCVNPDNDKERPQADCKLGSGLYAGPFSTVDDDEEDLEYGDGTKISGRWVEMPTMSINKVVKLKNVEIILAHRVALNGDGRSVGHFGLDWHPKQDAIWIQLCKQNKLPKQFTLALNTQSDDRSKAGYLAIGGDVGAKEVQVSGEWGSVGLAIRTAKEGGWMFEGVQVKWNDGQKDTIKDLKMEVVVDSGTTSLLLPKDIIAAFVKTLTPPLSFEPITSRYDIDCNAEGPATFDFVIGGVELKIPLKELISEYADCKCCLQLYDVKSRELDYAILGQSFMRHVVVRHDVDALSMSFKQRVY